MQVSSHTPPRVDTALTPLADDPSPASIAAQIQRIGDECINQINVSPPTIHYHVTLQESDLSAIQSVAQTHLSPPSSSPLPASDYGGVLESLRRHLFCLSNPYLVKHICETLEAFIKEQIDLSGEEHLMAVFQNASLPYETKEYFKKLFSRVYTTAISNPSQWEKIENDISKEIEDLAQKLRIQSNKILSDYEGWVDCERLFQLPGFSTLKDVDFKKLMKCIDLASTQELKRCVEQLNDTNAINFSSAEIYLKDTKYKYNLNTLLCEIIRKRPKKKEGIKTFWLHDPKFFIGKTLYLNDPSGISHAGGTIVKCEALKKGRNNKIFYLHDKSEVHIQMEPFQIWLTKSHAYSLLFAVNNETFENGAPLTIEYPTESVHTPTIDPGDYVLMNHTRGRSGLWDSSFELHGADQETKRYRLKILTKTHQVAIEKWDERRKRFKNKQTEGIHSFESSHRALKKIDQQITGIEFEKADDYILIKDEPNEDLTRLHHLKEIREELDQILIQLKQKEKLVDCLLDSLVELKLSKVNFDRLRSMAPNLASKITGLSRRYYDDLKAERSPADILKQIVLEANYDRLISKQDNVLMARTMGLLQAAYDHIKEIQSNDLILFMGNTGSGKSTSIGFLMGAQLDEFSNPVGEKVLKINETDSTISYPKIGQAIGTSETIYTQGYKHGDGDFLLGDCPGFNDTRGGPYELCTSFSIDQAIEKARTIRAIVIVLPAIAFLVDRGNNVINLIGTIKNRFLGTFDPAHIGKSRGVFLLVTKLSHVQPETLKNLMEGTRFTKLIGEESCQVKELEERYGVDSNEASPFKERLDVWRAISLMQSQNQVHYLEIDNLAQRDDLITWYAHPHQVIDKANYLPAMDTEYMQDKYNRCVEMSTHTWTTHIFEQYHKTISNLLDLEKALTKKESERVRLGNEKENRLKKAKVLLERQIKLKKYVDSLRANQAKLTEEGLRRELAEAARATEKSIKQEGANLLDNEKKLKEKNKELRQLEKDIKYLPIRIDEQIKNISDRQSKVNTLKTGVEIKKLFKFKPKAGTHIYRRWKEGAFDEAERTLCIKEDHFLKDTWTLETTTHKGSTRALAHIERGYRLVPSDPTMREQFFKLGEANGYIATVDGLRYKIAPGRATPDGKKIGYCFHLEWLGNGNIPWVKITHTIPNHEYNYATIQNLESEISLHEKELILLTKQMEGEDPACGLKQKKEVLENDVQILEKENAQHRTRIKNLKDAHFQKIADHLSYCEEDLSTLRIKQSELENTTAIHHKIQTAASEIATKKANIQVLKNKLRNLAIVIITHWESAKLLRDFADLVVKSSYRKARKETIESCQKFIEAFERNKDHLLVEIKNKYGF